MRYLKLLVVIVLMTWLALSVGACAPSESSTPGQTTGVETNDAGDAGSFADRVYRSLGAPDGDWEARSEGHDPVLEFDTAVRAAAVGVVGNEAELAAIAGEVGPVEDGGTTSRWKFPDGSVLVYVWTIDEANDRARVDSVEIQRP